jgi:predicted nuclease of predicted toxin-antitoxin system
MKLLLDMNLTPRWVGYLVEAGWETIHWSSVGAFDAKDSAICGWARENGHAVVTADLDFPQMLAHTGDDGPSIVLLRGDPLTPEVRGFGLAAALAECEASLDSGAIATIGWDDRLRVRLLPLR